MNTHAVSCVCQGEWWVWGELEQLFTITETYFQPEVHEGTSFIIAFNLKVRKEFQIIGLHVIDAYEYCQFN